MCLLITRFAIYNCVTYTFIFAVGSTRTWQPRGLQKLKLHTQNFWWTWMRSKVKPKLIRRFLTTTSLTCRMSDNTFNLYILNVNIKLVSYKTQLWCLIHGFKAFTHVVITKCSKPFFISWQWLTCSAGDNQTLQEPTPYIQKMGPVFQFWLLE